MKLELKTLEKLVREEMAHFGKQEPVEDHKNDAEETDADEYADSLEQHIDFMKALKIEEARLSKRLAKISEQKQQIMKKIKRG
jgi:hypothetical protein